MKLNRKTIIIVLIVISALMLVSAVAAKQATSKTPTKKVDVKIYNFQPGVLWGPKAVKLNSGDAIAGYVTYTGNMQFDRGTGVTTWYIGTGYNGDLEPHHTKLVKAKFYFKNAKGKVKTKTVTGNSAHLSTSLIKGYTPYKATVWYKTY